MREAGIRELKQNASAVVAAAAAGDVVTITDRRRPVAVLGPVRQGRLDSLVSSGRARPARTDLTALEPPDDTPGPDLTDTLRDMRDAERF